MPNLTPHHINENESENRSVKAGWYAARLNGTLRSGPFLSRDECMTEIEKAVSEPSQCGDAPNVH